MKYKYYENNKEKVEDISGIRNILSRGSNGNSVIIDTKHLPMLEDAENGDWLAKAELAEMFFEGAGVEKNYEIANYYTEQILSEVESDDYGSKAILEAKRNKANLEKEFGHYSEAAKWYIDALLFQQENLAAENWDFNIYTSLQEVLVRLKNEKQ